MAGVDSITEQHIKAYTRWVNIQLEKCSTPTVVEAINEDFRNGQKLCALATVLTKTPVKSETRSNPMFNLMNIASAIKAFESDRVELFNIHPKTICDGDLKMSLGMVWQLMLRYQVSMAQDEEDQTQKLNLTEIKQNILQIINDFLSTLPPTVVADISKMNPNSILDTTDGVIVVQDFDRSWRDGIAITGLVSSLSGDSKATVQKIEAYINAELAQGKSHAESMAAASLSIAKTSYNIPELIDAGDFVAALDANTMLAYLSYYPEYQKKADIDMSGGTTSSTSKKSKKKKNKKNQKQEAEKVASETAVNQPIVTIDETPAVHDNESSGVELAPPIETHQTIKIEIDEVKTLKDINSAITNDDMNALERTLALLNQLSQDVSDATDADIKEKIQGLQLRTQQAIEFCEKRRASTSEAENAVHVCIEHVSELERLKIITTSDAATLTTLKDELEELQQQLTAKISELESKQESITTLEEQDALNSQQKSQMEQQLFDLEAKIQELNTSYTSLSSEMSQKDSTNSDQAQEIEALALQLQQSSQSLENSLAELAELKQKHDDLEKLNRESALQQESDNIVARKHSEEVQKLSSTISELEKSLQESENVLSSLKSDHESLGETLKTQSEELSSVKDLLSGSEKTHHALQTELDEVKEQLTQQSQDHTDAMIVSKSKIEELEAVLTTTKQQLEDSQQLAKSLQDQIRDNEVSIAMGTGVTDSKVSDLTNQVSQLQAELAHESSQLVSTQSELEKLQESQTELAKLRELQTETDSLREEVDTLKQQMEEMVPSSDFLASDQQKSAQAAKIIDLEAEIVDLKNSLHEIPSLEDKMKTITDEMEELQNNLSDATLGFQAKQTEHDMVLAQTRDDVQSHLRKVAELESLLQAKDAQLQEQLQQQQQQTETDPKCQCQTLMVTSAVPTLLPMENLQQTDSASDRIQQLEKQLLDEQEKVKKLTMTNKKLQTVARSRKLTSSGSYIKEPENNSHVFGARNFIF